MVKNEFSESLREITMLGFGLVLICHSKEKTSGLTDVEGNPIMRVEPDGPKQMREVIDALVDIIGFIGVEFNQQTGESERYLYTRSTPTIFAGSRYKFLQPKIKFGYNELVNAISEAIDMDVKTNGAEVTDHTETPQIKSRPFNEVMDEAREMWIKYLENASNDEEKDQHLRIMKDIIKKVFGTEEFKLSQALPSQVDLLDLFCTELKDIM